LILIVIHIFILTNRLIKDSTDMELQLLCSKPGVRVWDEYKQEHFDLRALLFVTINDWPALINLSSKSNKGYNACTECYEDFDCVFLKNVERSCTLATIGFFL